MEPVFSVLGESSGVAAAIAAREDCEVQEIDVRALRAALAARGQRLEWPSDCGSAATQAARG
jgi:FAD-dependent oxidoreductase family protein